MRYLIAVLFLFIQMSVWDFLVDVSPAQEAAPPNVVIVITDDQGYGDLSCMGNPVLKTPNLDDLYRDSVRLSNYHVSPTCSQSSQKNWRRFWVVPSTADCTFPGCASAHEVRWWKCRPGKVYLLLSGP